MIETTITANRSSFDKTHLLEILEPSWKIKWTISRIQQKVYDPLLK